MGALRKKDFGKSYGRTESQKLEVQKEIELRMVKLWEKDAANRVDMQLKSVGLMGGPMTNTDYIELSNVVKRLEKADQKIQREYDDTGHPFWGYKAAQAGIKTFNKRIMVPEKFAILFLEAYTGCFCTKYKTHMLSGWKEPEKLVARVEQAKRIGHPYEMVFVPEGQEEAVDALRKSKAIHPARIVMWLNPFTQEPPLEERKEKCRKQGINAMGSSDMGALFYTPKKEDGVDLAGQLTGLDQWMDRVLKNRLVKIDYKKEMYRPPYAFSTVK